LEQLLGSDQGLSTATITRLITQWPDEAKALNVTSTSRSQLLVLK